jgi:hypothetical protein
MQLTSLAAIKRACQPGAHLAILATDVPHMQLNQAHGLRRIEQAKANAIALRGSYGILSKEFDPDVLSWIEWPKVANIEFHGDDTFTLTGIARYSVLPGLCEHCEHQLEGDQQTLCHRCNDPHPSPKTPTANTTTRG